MKKKIIKAVFKYAKKGYKKFKDKLKSKKTKKIKQQQDKDAQKKASIKFKEETTSKGLPKEEHDPLKQSGGLKGRQERFYGSKPYGTHYTIYKKNPETGAVSKYSTPYSSEKIAKKELKKLKRGEGYYIKTTEPPKGVTKKVLGGKKVGKSKGRKMLRYSKRNRTEKEKWREYIRKVRLLLKNKK